MEHKQIREDGQFRIWVDPSCALFDGLEDEQEVLLTHGDSVTTAPPSFRVVGRSGAFVAALEGEGGRVWGVQFHPEVGLTAKGKEMFRNFLFKVRAGGVRGPREGEFERAGGLVEE